MDVHRTSHLAFVPPPSMTQEEQEILMLRAAGHSNRTAHWWYWMREKGHQFEEDIPEESIDDLDNVPLG